MQARTPHARALQPWSGERFAGRTLRDRAGTEYALTKDGIRIRRGGEIVEAPIRWAFGSGEQAITPVLERAGKWIELRLSWYRAGDRLGLTPGHDPAPPFELADHLGIEQTERNAQRCFGCHTTWRRARRDVCRVPRYTRRGTQYAARPVRRAVRELPSFARRDVPIRHPGTGRSAHDSICPGRLHGECVLPPRQRIHLRFLP